MLTKLLKYEFKATARVMVPLCILSIALASVTQITLWELVGKVPGRSPSLLNLLLLIATAVAMGAVLAATVVLMIQRFRSNLLGDEGHLMFSLPVSSHQHIWTKLLVAVFWILATLFILFESTVILGYNGTLWTAFPQIQEFLVSHFSSSSDLNFSPGVFLAFLFTAIFVGAGELCLEIYAALALGHSFHKHKTLLSVVFFLVIQVLYHLTGGITPFLADLAFFLFPPTNIHILDLGVSIVSGLLWAAVLYAITHYTLKHRLNLE